MSDSYREGDKHHILVVEDDLLTARVCQTYLKQGGHVSKHATTGHEAIEELAKRNFDIIMLDLGLPDMSGFDIMDFLKDKITAHQLAVIIITGDSELTSAAKAVDKGAYDYVVKPFDATRLLTTITNAQNMLEMHQEKRKESKSGGLTLSDTLGIRVPVSFAEQMVLAASRNRKSVYIVGESFEAKESVARSIHEQSRRNKSPFISLNCANFQRGQMAREIFGDVRSTIPGALARAEGGTLFLDMVSYLPLNAQKMLVQFLTAQNYHRIGETSWRTGDVRLICASARELREEMEEGRYFLGDLYFYLCESPLFLPSGETLLMSREASSAL